MASFRVEPFRWEDHAAAVRDLYCEVFSEPPYHGISQVGAEETLRRQAGYSGLDGRVALADNGQLLGFAYGWDSNPGQPWHDRMRSLFGPELSRRWLSDCFEFAELGVRLDARGQGIGAALHDALLLTQPHATAVVSTNPLAAAAQYFYRARGWQIILEPVFFSEGSPALRFWGKDLR